MPIDKQISARPTGVFTGSTQREKKWFAHDVEALKGDNPKHTWYDVLFAAATTLLLHGIFVKNDFYNQGRRRIAFHSQSLPDLLTRVPTKWGVGGTCPPFPIMRLSLTQWSQRFVKIAPKAHIAATQRKYNTPLPTDLDSHTLETKALSLMDGQEEVFIDDCQESATVSRLAMSAREDIFQHVDRAYLTLEEIDFFQRSRFPPQPLSAPQWTPFLQRMSMMNIYGQLDLAYRRTEQVQIGCKFLLMEMEDHVARLEAQKAELVAQTQAVSAANKVVNTMRSKTQRLSAEGHRIADGIKEGMRHPAVQKFMAGKGLLGNSPPLGSTA
jgi:hypothetical protein